MKQPEHSSSQPENQNPETEKSLFTRRQFVGTGIMAAAALALPKLAQADTESLVQKSTIPTNSAKITAPFNVPFQEPKKIPSYGGYLKHEINIQPSKLELPSEAGGKTIDVRTYNCYIPGETLYVEPGDQIQILLNNQLSEDGNQPCPAPDLKTKYEPHCFNTTNLHFHGLHVSPKSKDGIASDDVLVTVPPSGNQKYCVQLPDFHAPGTHWYHSHLHGATGLQVSNGLAGAIIIPEPPENQIVPPERDKVWLIQEVIGGLPDQTDIYPKTRNQGRTIPAQYLVNGIYQPKITINKNQWQRWRFINAGATPRSLMNLKLVKSLQGKDNKGNSCNFPPQQPTDPKELNVCNIDTSDILSMWLIAVDGISFYGHKPQEKKGWELAPGNRADFLVWFPEDNQEKVTYYLIKDANPGGGRASQVSVQILAEIEVLPSTNNDIDQDSPSSYTIPGELPNYLKPIEKREIFDSSGKIKHHQDILFEVPKTPDPGYGQYTVNGHQYGVDDSSIKVNLNTAEVWTLRNSKENFRRGSAHPFHIHVNPFQIVGDKIDPSGPNDSSNWRWWDTIAVTLNSCETIIHRFPDYDGHFVFHCHILIHEDLGMMQDVIISGDGTPPCQKLSESSFSPQTKDYVTCDQVKAALSQIKLEPPAPECKVCTDSTPTNTPTTATPNTQVPTKEQGASAKVPGSGQGGGGKGLGGGKGTGGGLGKM